MRTALLIIDMINTLEFPEANSLRRYAVPVARNILQLKQRFYKNRLPVIYVNDNFDEWLSDWNKVYEKCSAPGMKGAGIAGDICVMFTAHEAHARGFEVIVPENCIASNTKAQNKVAIQQLQKALKLKTTKFQNLRLGKT